MASELILKKLFETSKKSDYFKGTTEDEIWKACLSYKDRPDEDIRAAIGNIKKKDIESATRLKEQRMYIEENKSKMNELKKKEELDRRKDRDTAENILEDFFNL